MTTCPRCREPLAARQEYCLHCGARVSDVRRAHGWGASWTRRSLVAGAAALAAAIGAIAATGSDAGGPTIETALGGFAQAPKPADGEAPESRSGVAEWPVGEDGWTIALASLPQTGGRAPALARARAARAKGLTAVGVLDSSRYASLHPGYWIVFSGIYASEAEATSALDRATRYVRTASVRRVVP
jgi:hypothetical protein